MTSVPRIGPYELNEKLARGEKVFILDVRTPAAYEESSFTIPGAVRIPAAEVSSRLNELPRDVPIVTYCT